MPFSSELIAAISLGMCTEDHPNPPCNSQTEKQTICGFSPSPSDQTGLGKLRPLLTSPNHLRLVSKSSSLAAPLQLLLSGLALDAFSSSCSSAVCQPCWHCWCLNCLLLLVSQQEPAGRAVGRGGRWPVLSARRAGWRRLRRRGGRAPPVPSCEIGRAHV